jgi:transposase
VIVYAAIDIHKHAFQVAVLDPESGELVEERFAADRESLARWAEQWRVRVVAVAIEATTGWRWVWRELVERGFEVRLAEPLQTRRCAGRLSSPNLTAAKRSSADRAVREKRCTRALRSRKRSTKPQ